MKEAKFLKGYTKIQLTFPVENISTCTFKQIIKKVPDFLKTLYKQQKVQFKVHYSFVNIKCFALIVLIVTVMREHAKTLAQEKVCT